MRAPEAHRSHRTALALLAGLLSACAAGRPAASPAATPAAASPSSGASGLDLAGMDRAAVPGDDFYGHANGAWLAAAVIPPDRGSTGPGLEILELVSARTRDLDEAAARAGAPAGSETQQIGDFYASFMDEAGIEAAGLEPRAPTLRRLAALADGRALAAELGSQLRADVDLLNVTDLSTDRVLGVWVEQDLNEPSRNVAYLVQGGLGLPDRAYYLDPGDRFVALRAAYRAHLAAVLRLLGERAEAADEGAARVLAFETQLAQGHGSRADAGEVQKGNNPWTRADLDAKAPGLDWSALLGAAGLGGQRDFVVWQPGAVTSLAALARSAPLATWKAYLRVRAVERAAPFLPRAFVQERFGFYGTTLRGTPRLLDRWKRGVAFTNAALGDAVGKAYVARHFPPEARRELQAMVERIVAAFGRRIDRLDWMTTATKARARAKLATLTVGVGYPDAWERFDGLVVVRGDALGNAERAELHAYRRALAKLGRPPDRAEWCLTPQTVNAVNLPLRNALNFPAGFLEPPFYDRNASAAVKYGSIGATIGHEISHSFDDQGALFEADGRVANWWSPEDLAHFEAAGARLVAQYDAYRPLPGLAVNGKLTLSENIADLAGLAVAHDAWKASLGGAPAPVLDGLSGDQQFFLSYAQSWRSKDREEALREALLTDGHAPDQVRALTVRNLDGWYEAFDVRPGQALHLDPAGRVRVW